VEPTNKAAARALRRALVWRRRSVGTQRAAGSLVAARLLTVAPLLRPHDRAVLASLTVA